MRGRQPRRHPPSRYRRCYIGCVVVTVESASAKPGQPGTPGGFQAAVVGEAAVEFEDDHAVDEGEGGPGAFGAAGRPDQGGCGAVLQPGGRCSRGSGPSVISRYSWGWRRRRPVGGAQRGQRFGGTVGGGVEGLGRFLEAGGDEGDFEGGLVGQVLVQRRRADAEPVGEASHGQRLGAFGFQQFPGDRHDLPGARAQWLTHAGRCGCSARCLSAAFIASKAGWVWRSSERASSGTSTPVKFSSWDRRTPPSRVG